MGIWSKLKQSFKAETVLYYPGCLTEKLLKKQLENYKDLLNRIRVNFIMLPELNCCGSVLLNNGYKKEFYEIIEKNKKILNKHPINKILTNCPYCAEIFNNFYDIESEHIGVFLAKHLRRLRALPSEKIALINSPIVYNVFGESSIFKKLLERVGYIVEDFPHKKDNVVFCGDGGGLIYNNPELANKLAENCLKQIENKKVVVVGPLTYLHLKKNNKFNKKIIEFSDALAQE